MSHTNASRGREAITDSIEEQVLRGTVKRVTFRNPENGYTIFKLGSEDNSEEHTITARTLEVSAGQIILARGFFRLHPKFGMQFEASSVTESTPSDLPSLIRYLGGGSIKGIGIRTAERIVEAFGDKTMETIQSDAASIARVSGVGAHKAAILVDAFKDHSSMREILRFLLENGLSQNLAHRIFKRFGNKAVELITRDPYQLARSSGLKGVGFLTADKLASALGIDKHAPQRLIAGLLYALEKASDDGHCFLPQAVLFERACSLLSLPADFNFRPALDTLAAEREIVIAECGVYPSALDRAERSVADFIRSRLDQEESTAPGYSIEQAISTAEQALNITLSEQQRLAVSYATQHRLALITGGPGCGKTTVIRALSLLFKQAGKRLALCAPTGKAAQRMAQVCDMPASTIHRLLKYDPIKGSFVFGAKEPLNLDAIIVDESSMVDMLLARDLFAAIPKSATIILVGDKDQLPSVGPGRVFADLMQVTNLPKVELDRIFRRAEQSSITSVAHSINAGLIPEIPTPDGETKSDSYFILRPEAEDAARTVERLIFDQIPNKFGFSNHEIGVLTPSNRGILGTTQLNHRLQARLNPPEKYGADQEIIVGETVFRLGDRVCQRVNNYKIDVNGVFNGDNGIIHQVDKATRALVVEMWDGRLIRYSEREISQLALAYCSTVHRAQGTEIACVVLVLHESHYALLERQLVYTAVTRAKKLLIIVGSKRALAIASRKANSTKRCSNLVGRIPGESTSTFI